MGSDWKSRWLLLSFEASLIVVALVAGKLLGYYPLAHVRINPVEVAQGVLATLPMVAALAVCLAWPGGPWSSLVRFVDDALVPLFSDWSVAELALAALLAGLGEEMLFRGVVQWALVEAARPWGPVGIGAAVVAASLIFGLAHSITRSYIVFATLIGLYLGGLFLATRNLLQPIIAHALYDFVALWYLSRVRKVAEKSAS